MRDDVNRGPRRSRGRPALPMDRILGAAVELLDAEGADALSMRSLAQRLGSGTATLYRHFSNRSELVSQVIDHILGEVDLDARALADLPWQQACITFAQHMFDALRRHGNVAPLLIEYTPTGPSALANRERCLVILLDNGFAPAVAAHAYATLARYVLGFALQLPGATDGGGEAELSAAFHRLDPSRYPATVTVTDELPVPLADEFAFGLRLIVSGLERLRE
ncbi:putative transcriptional regulator, TetR family protein [Mycobacterium intracellulare]|nr:bacterial regulatory s, tetR family protein [Mycobacterium intracellulare MIN_061107_1834]BCO49455.1 putative transcriptional regulator, TetR family protein [Mycobacterium intracellulare]BCO65235.1 putative transcriptional regulator, TetR family protein [Mycobacterium intracellulare]BCO70584.1 putative transcriptional regulator, TetR family protein [Mycobacterium intracellulare]BCP23491.1 putative transcriptional regulator, TetR family protein [Mycobacterium intracellulare]